MTQVPASSRAAAAQYLRRVLTAAEIKTLTSAPVALVAAPSASQVVWPLTVVTFFHPGTVAFDVFSTVIFGWGPNGTGPDVTGFLQTGAATNAARVRTSDIAADLVANVSGGSYSANVGLSFDVRCGEGDSAAGNGTLTIILGYVILTD